MAISGSYVYAATNDLDVIDVSNPASPTLVSSLRFNSIVPGLAVQGSHVLVPTSFSLRSIDVSNPSEPSLVGTVALDDYNANRSSVAVYENFAFLAAGDVSVVDVASPVSPTPVGSSPTVGFAGDLAVSGNLACVADGPDGGLQIVDVSNPMAPELVGGIDTPGDAHAVAVVDHVAFLADGGAGLHVIDFSNPSMPEIMASVGSGARDVAVAGERAYVIVSDTQLDVVDVSNPRNPNVVSSVLRGNTLANHFLDWHNVAASGDYVYIGSHVDLTVVDVSNPVAPVVTATIGWRDGAADFTVQGSYLYALDTHHHFLITDVSDPHNPRTVGSLNLVVLARDISVRGSYAYITAIEGRGLRVYDVSDPTSPRTTWGALLPNEGYGVAVAGEFVLVGAGWGGLQVFPAQCDEVVPVTLHDFVAEAQHGAVEIRWNLAASSDPAEFRLEATNGNDIWRVSDVTRTANRFVAMDDAVFLAAGGTVKYTLYAREVGQDWTILGRTEATLVPTVLRTRLLRPRPNPFNPRTTIRYVMARNERAQLVIFGLDGRRVATLVDGVLPKGAGRIDWDGTDHRGRPVPSGLYIARLASQRASASQKLVLLR